MPSYQKIKQKKLKGLNCIFYNYMKSFTILHYTGMLFNVNLIEQKFYPEENELILKVPLLRKINLFPSIKLRRNTAV